MFRSRHKNGNIWFRPVNLLSSSQFVAHDWRLNSQLFGCSGRTFRVILPREAICSDWRPWTSSALNAQQHTDFERRQGVEEASALKKHLEGSRESSIYSQPVYLSHHITEWLVSTVKVEHVNNALTRTHFNSTTFWTSSSRWRQKHWWKSDVVLHTEAPLTLLLASCSNYEKTQRKTKTLR